MSTKSVITPSNLGNEFDLGNIEAGKIHLKLDSSLQRNAQGELGVSASGLTSLLEVTADNSNNVLTIDVNGVSATANVITSNAISVVSGAVIKTIVNGVESNTIDLAPLVSPTDIHVDSGQLDINGTTLVITRSNGAANVEIDLAALAASNVQDSITGDGTVASPLKLAGDQTAPGNLKFYGTDDVGAKGWHDLATLAELAITKGNLSEGQGIALTGELGERLVGLGDVTVSLDLSTLPAAAGVLPSGTLFAISGNTGETATAEQVAALLEAAVPTTVAASVDSSVFTSTVNGVSATVAVHELVDAFGTVIGKIFA